MAEATAISWTDHTWSPWRGCSHKHTGCTRCYAEALGRRTGVRWGPNTPRIVNADFLRAGPQRNLFRWDSKAATRGVVETVFPSLCDPFELHDGEIHDPKKRRLCVGPSDSVLYARKPIALREEAWLTLDEVRNEFFRMVDGCQNLRFLILTKRPENVRAMWDGGRGLWGRHRWNVALIYSASDQETLDDGLPHLLACRHLCPVLGLSLEPLIGPVDLRRHAAGLKGCRLWVIMGGESTQPGMPPARVCDVGWMIDVVRQCRELGLVPYVKQLGSNVEASDLIDAADYFPGDVELSQGSRDGSARVKLRDGSGTDPAEWPVALQVQEYPWNV